MATNWAGTYKQMRWDDVSDAWKRFMLVHDESKPLKRSNGMSVYLGCAVRRKQKDEPLEVLVQPTVLEAGNGAALAVLLSRLHDPKVDGQVDYLGFELPKQVTA
jgi:hypothetical protein